MDAQVPRTQQTFKSLPFQVIETHTGMILRRGCIHLKIQGKGAAAAVHHLLSVCSSKGDTLESLVSQFAAHEQPNIERLIQRLLDKNFFVPVEEDAVLGEELQESPLDVFYWHFGETTEGITQRLNTMPVVLMGVNLLSSQLWHTLHSSGMNNLQIVDHPLLRNPCLFDNKGRIRKTGGERDFLLPLRLKEWETIQNGSAPKTVVVASEFGPTEIFQELNRQCLEKQDHFFPVWLEDMIGYLGPLVIPGESPCFQCVRERMNSHADDPETQDRIHNQSDFSGGYPVGFHPAMVSILGDLAAFELTKFYSSLFSNSILGRFIEVSLLAPRLKSRKIFKLPRCPVCSPLRTTPSMTSKFDVCMEPK